MHPFLRLTCRLGRVFAAGLVVFALTACTPSAKTYQPPSKPTTTTPTPTPTPTVVPSATLAARALTRDEQHAVNLAVDQYRRYAIAYDEMVNSGTPDKALKKARDYLLPGSQADKTLLYSAAEYRKHHVIGYGPTKVCKVNVASVALPKSQLLLRVSADLTGAYFTENGGPKQPAVNPYTTAIVTFKYTRGTWLVSSVEAEKGEKC